MNPEEQLRSSWQSSAADSALPPIEELRTRTDKFQRKIARRNLIEYIAGVIVVLAFGAYVFVLPGWPLKLGSAMIIAGTCFVMWRLHRHGSSRAMPENAGASSLIAFRRAELVRQRNLIDSVLSWYLAPLIPGLALFLSAPALMAPAGQVMAVLPSLLGPFAFCALVFGGIWALNKHAAKKLSREIAALDALGTD